MVISGTQMVVLIDGPDAFLSEESRIFGAVFEARPNAGNVKDKPGSLEPDSKESNDSSC